MAVKTYIPADPSVQSANVTPGIVADNLSVIARIGAAFAPHQNTPADMSVAVDAGWVNTGSDVLEVAAQITTPIVAPTTDSRIDRVVVSKVDGSVSVIAGTEAATPVAPAIPGACIPVAQILLDATTTTITNAIITDERTGAGTTPSVGVLKGIKTFTASGTYVPTDGTTYVIAEAVGGGGGGGGCTAAAAASGGCAGCFVKGYYPIDFTSIDVVVGTGGAGGTAGNNTGTNGGTTSIGNLLSAGGGDGGHGSATYTTPVLVGPAGQTSTATGGNITNSVGQQGFPGLALRTSNVLGGAGGASNFGGGAGFSPGTDGADAVSPGSGGAGASSVSGGGSKAGGNGADGFIVIYEYS